MTTNRQRVMHCPCGKAKVLALGLCATCYTLKRQDEEHFGGLREAVLERDGYRCRVCAKIHRTKAVLSKMPPLLLELWREQHPEGHEQTALNFDPRKPSATHVPLFAEKSESGR